MAASLFRFPFCVNHSPFVRLAYFGLYGADKYEGRLNIWFQTASV